MIYKRLICALLFILIISVPSFTVYAYNVDEYTENGLKASGADELSAYLSEETKEYLKKLGCADIDFEALLDVSAESVFELMGEMLKNGLKEPLKAFLKSAGIVLLVSVCSGFFPDDEKSRIILNLICGSVTVIGVLVPAVNVIRAAVSTIGLCVTFEKALIPVLAGVLTAGGNPALALTFKGAAFAAAEFVEYFAGNFSMPIIGISGALGITGAMLPTLRLSAVSDVIRKTVTTSLGCVSGLFSGFLALKSVLSSSADALIIRGVRTAASFIPVVGGSLGEAYNSVSASISLLKGTVGIYAVVALILMVVPVAINLALWVFAMRFACTVSEVLDCGVCSEILKNIAFIFSLTNSILLLCTAVFVISSGLVVAVKAGE